jgi:hypothetical protein
MSDSSSNGVPILLWPFYALWRFLSFVLEMIGRRRCAMLGIGLMVGGVAITLSIIGAPVGIPLASIGFLLLVRAIF